MVERYAVFFGSHDCVSTGATAAGACPAWGNGYGHRDLGPGAQSPGGHIPECNAATGGGGGASARFGRVRDVTERRCGEDAPGKPGSAPRHPRFHRGRHLRHRHEWLLHSSTLPAACGHEPAECLAEHARAYHHSYPNGEPYPVEKCPIFEAFRARPRLPHRQRVLWRMMQQLLGRLFVAAHPRRRRHRGARLLLCRCLGGAQARHAAEG